SCGVPRRAPAHVLTSRSIVARERLGLEGLQRLRAALDGRMRLRPEGGAEVVATVDLGQPRAKPRQVGLGLLDLLVGRAVAGALAAQLLQERRHAREQLAVLIVAGGL